METTGKTPVNIIQELIAIHTTRQEAYKKISGILGNDLQAGKLNAAISQSTEFVTELLGELSQFGDAVSDTVDRDNEFQSIWKNASTGEANMDAGQASATYESMEKALKQIYSELVNAGPDTSSSLVDILGAQMKAL